VSRVVLETSRLSLREMTSGDLDFLAALLADPDVMRFYPSPLDREGARAWLDKTLARYERDGHAFWLATEKATGEPVGQVGVLLQEVEGERFHEVGYLFARAHWKRGFATEAARACRDWAFDKGAPRVISLIRPENLPSAAVARRNGMTIERQVTFHNLPHDLWSLRAPQ